MIRNEVVTRLSFVALTVLPALLLGAYAIHDTGLVRSHAFDGPVEQVLAVLLAIAVAVRVAVRRRLFAQVASARRQELEALTRFETIYERAPIGMGLVSLDGHLRDTNPVMREITGFTAEELAAQNVLDYTLSEDIEQTAKLFAGMLAGNHDSYRHEMRLRAKDGSVVWVDSATVLLHDADGKPQVALSMASNITERRLAEEQLRRQNAQLEASERERTRLLARTVEVAEQERMRIATELHDGPIQKLTVVGFNVERLGIRIARNEPGAEELMHKIRTDLQTQMFALRRVMSDLRPPILDERDLAAALSDCAQQVFADASVECETTCVLGSDWPAPEIETAIYRVVREALVNVRRHADATRVDVAVKRDGESLRVLVTDDGGGFDHADPDIEQFGLLGMQERIGSLGGRLEVESVVGSGTRVEATLPWKSRLEPAAA
jgi:two-component system sensor histidine kinase UhpB